MATCSLLSGESLAEIGKSAVNLILDSAVCGGDLAIFRANINIHLRFLGYVTDAYPSVVQKSRMGRGDIVVHVSAGKLKRLRVGLPPADEQAAIVKYLSHANARIDRVIVAKRKLIGLLAEQKQAIINQAVTRGLDPSVPLKDSGLPWLGEIPAHWDVISTGAASLMIQTGPFGSQLHAEEYIDGGVPVINPSHLVATEIVPDPAVSLRQSKVAELARHCLKHGDVIAARRGELGRCAVVGPREVGWLCGTGSLLIRLRSEMFCPSYFQLFFSAQQTKAQLEAGSVGATMSNLNAQMVGRLRIPKPPFEEQHAIFEAVELLTRRKAAEEEKVLREIELLREFRTRLTADVVTGQVDIRAAAARLPELNQSDLISDVVGSDEDDLDAELAESLEAVDA